MELRTRVCARRHINFPLCVERVLCVNQNTVDRVEVLLSTVASARYLGTRPTEVSLMHSVCNSNSQLGMYRALTKNLLTTRILVSVRAQRNATAVLQRITQALAIEEAEHLQRLKEIEEGNAEVKARMRP